MADKRLTVDELNSLIEEKIENVVKRDLIPGFAAQLDRLAKLPGPAGMKPGLYGLGKGKAEEANFFEEKDEGFEAGGFKSFQDFLRTVSFTPGDKRLIRTKLEEGDPELGGYVCPTGYTERLFSTALQKSDLAALVTKVPMTEREQKFPRVVDSDHSSNEVFGGIIFRWKDEKATKEESEPKLGEVTLRANTCASLCKITNQLLEDSRPPIQRALNQLFADAFGWTLDNALIRGTGAGQPLGILNSLALIPVPKEGGQAADTILFKNVQKMFARMHPALRGESVWLISPSAQEEIYDMSIAIGTGGSSVMLAGGAIAPLPESIFGQPIIWTEHCSALGDLGDIILAHPKSLLLGLKKDLTIDSSIHVHFVTNETLFRIEARLDAQPIVNEKLTIRSGGGFQVSPFVTLAAR